MAFRRKPLKFLAVRFDGEPCFGRIFKYLFPPAIGIFGRPFGRRL
jgi:hypothetical protein